MAERPDPATFRKQATFAYNAAMRFLSLFFVGCLVAGWFIGGFWGVVIGAVAGFILAGGGAMVATLLWAMSQDGA